MADEIEHVEEEPVKPYEIKSYTQIRKLVDGYDRFIDLFMGDKCGGTRKMANFIWDIFVLLPILRDRPIPKPKLATPKMNESEESLAKRKKLYDGNVNDRENWIRESHEKRIRAQSLTWIRHVAATSLSFDQLTVQLEEIREFIREYELENLGSRGPTKMEKNCGIIKLSDHEKNKQAFKIQIIDTARWAKYHATIPDLDRPYRMGVTCGNVFVSVNLPGKSSQIWDVPTDLLTLVQTKMESDLEFEYMIPFKIWRKQDKIRNCTFRLDEYKQGLRFRSLEVYYKLESDEWESGQVQYEPEEMVGRIPHHDQIRKSKSKPNDGDDDGDDDDDDDDDGDDDDDDDVGAGTDVDAGTDDDADAGADANTDTDTTANPTNQHTPTQDDSETNIPSDDPSEWKSEDGFGNSDSDSEPEPDSNIPSATGEDTYRSPVLDPLND